MTRFAWASLLLSLVATGAAPRDAFLSDPAVRPLSAAARAGDVTSQEPRLGVPTFFWANRRPAPPGLTAAEAARHHLLAHAELYRASSPGWASAHISSLHDLHDGSAIIVTFQQRIGDVRVFRDELKVILNRDLELIALAGYLTPATTPLGHFALRPESAIASAALILGRSVGPEAISPLGTEEGGYSRWKLEGASSARTRPVYFPLPSGLVPSFYGELKVQAGWFSFVVSAVDGSVLFLHELTVSHSYSVWADPVTLVPFPGPTGGDATPHPTGLPNALAPTPVPQQVVTLVHAGLSTGDRWLPANATDTRGNNVHAYADLDLVDGYSRGDLLGTTTAPQTFSWPYDFALSAEENAAQRRAAVTQLFYTTNFLHDWFYDDGFNEAAGNAQAQNFSRGGAGSDPLLAEAHDLFIRNNASMGTPSDGESPTMQMGIFDGAPSRPAHDSAIDNGVVAHEWGHFISNRLIGDGNGITTVQSRGLGEGWGDFHAALLVVDSTDALVPVNAGWQGTWSLGGWAWEPSDAEAFYWGLRRYPLSVSFARNPLTFRHIGDGAPLPMGAPSAPLRSGYPNSETHNTGEVWAVVLWECYVELLRDPRLTFDQARARMKRYLVAAYKATPLAPTFIEAREALLAVVAANDLTDVAHFWDAFARRGLGRGAVAPDRNSFDNLPVVESFVVGNPARFGAVTLDDSVLACDADGVLDGDEAGHLRVVVRNTDTAPISGTMTVSSSSSGVSFPAGTAFPVLPIAALGSATVVVPVALADLAGPLPTSFVLSFSGPTLGPDPVTSTVLLDLNYDLGPGGAHLEDTCINRAPVATVGPDVEVDEGVRVVLIGSGVDPEGAQVSLSWVQLAGPAGIVRENAFTAPEVTVDTQVTLALTVSDGRAPSQPVEQHLLIKNVNRTPFARAPLSAEGISGERITLTGTASDSDGDPITFKWTQLSGPTAALDGSLTRTVRVVLPEVTGVETLRLQLVVSDGLTMSLPEVTVITVRGAVEVIRPLPVPEKPTGCSCSSGEAGLLALAVLVFRRRRGVDRLRTRVGERGDSLPTLSFRGSRGRRS